ncbi:MarR family winged helix-turn-helix transcriptional regulator [Alicyclobacillus sp. ALC3]|uniref:MarR family winged helix-turn-helix transcriptional regulator n=1 Tax=Alicyclobacillus sp. ALC3 TaxID=2796143 RepID=UPI002378CD7F|nr:MarR family transcriptional regulator [Alicyclobacillus sp. ALC3]WDL97748.1 MarR family transcriptional regulator [Alicyclobacillus sp. ALC3]
MGQPDMRIREQREKLYAEKAEQLQAKIHAIVDSYDVVHPDLHKPSTELSILVARVYNMVSTLLNGYTSTHGLTHAKFTTLLLLYRTPGYELRMSEISEENHVTRTNITKLVDGLESEGYVQRRQDRTDRRSSLIQLTNKGRSYVEDHLESYLQLQRLMFNELSAREQESLITILYKLLFSLTLKGGEGELKPDEFHRGEADSNSAYSDKEV